MVYRVSTDSRAVMPGDLFIALMGDKFDGQDFIAEVMEKGAAAALVQMDWVQKNRQPGISLILVENTRLALGRLAAYWRRRFQIPLVAVTGSNGKTTVKEMIASILHMLLLRQGRAGQMDGSGQGAGDGRESQQRYRRAFNAFAIARTACNTR